MSGARLRRTAVGLLGAVLALVLPAGAGGTDASRGKASPTASPQRQKQLKSEQQRLKQRLVRLKEQVAKGEASHAVAADALRESEAAISKTNRRLRELAADRQQAQREIDALTGRSAAVTVRRSDEERALSAVLRSQYVLSRQTTWQRALDGSGNGQLQRDLTTLDYAARRQLRTLGELRARGEELAAVRAQLEVKEVELASLAEEEQRSRAELLAQQASRSRALARLASQLEGQRRSLRTLQRDDKRLTALIAEIERLLAERARPKPRQSARAARPQAGKAAAPADAEIPAGGAFAQLRGKLVLPVQGAIVARFGSPRPTEAQVDAPTWKGIFIRARTGADVHSIAAGRVVFADWLRGFGNLMVIDHGEGFLSVYGNNEALLATVGDAVAAGDPVATVGSTGGVAESGLYFEIRFKGQPIDPLRWAQAR